MAKPTPIHEQQSEHEGVAYRLQIFEDKKVGGHRLVVEARGADQGDRDYTQLADVDLTNQVEQLAAEHRERVEAAEVARIEAEREAEIERLAAEERLRREAAARVDAEIEA